MNVNGIPAGTTCTATETTSDGYTTSVVVADGGGDDGGAGGDGAVPTGTPAGSALTSNNCQDGGGFAPFNLQIQNTGPFPFQDVNWEMIWRDRPYSTIPGLNAGPYTHTVVPNANGLFDHVFVGTQPLTPFQNLAITGGAPTPMGDNSCAQVEHFLDPSGCLLYTSPSPRDQRGSRMPSSA